MLVRARGCMFTHHFLRRQAIVEQRSAKAVGAIEGGAVAMEEDGADGLVTAAAAAGLSGREAAGSDEAHGAGGIQIKTEV